MESILVDAVNSLLEEYKKMNKIQLEKLNTIEQILFDIKALLNKDVEETKNVNENIKDIQDSLISIKND